MKKINGVVLYLLFIGLIAVIESKPHDEQPLSRIAIHKTIMALHESAYVKVSHSSLGSMGHHTDWVTVNFSNPNPSHDDWIGVFSPANFSAATCSPENPKVSPPLLCTAPIKYQYANYSSQDYIKTGKGSLALQMINQREDFSFALFSGGLTHELAVEDKLRGFLK